MLGGLAKHSLWHRKTRQGPQKRYKRRVQSFKKKKKEFKNPFIRTGAGLALNEKK